MQERERSEEENISRKRRGRVLQVGHGCLGREDPRGDGRCRERVERERERGQNEKMRRWGLEDDDHSLQNWFVYETCAIFCC